MTTLGIDAKTPTIQDTLNLMPKGRRPYSLVRWALSSEQPIMYRHGESGPQINKNAVIALADASREGILTPRLPDELRDAVYAADSCIERQDAHIEMASGVVSIEYNPVVVKYILDAVFEHGYRSDGV